MGSHRTISDRMVLRVAELELSLDASGSGIRFNAPVCHTQFVAGDAKRDGLRLTIRDEKPSGTGDWRSLFYDAETWQLWLDGAGRYVFVPPKRSPPYRQIAVETAFRTGEVVGEFAAGAPDGRAVYPLQGIDMALYANWLACYGDMILHAAGVAVDGQGYCFVGASGAGKSTLTTTLAATAAVTVLGEDQVILRRINDQFWIYGTPWHENTDRCSPGGAPLEKLFFLNRTIGNGVEACGRIEGITRLLQTAFVPYYRPDAVDKILDNLGRLAEQVPFYTLGYQLGADVIRLIREA